MNPLTGVSLARTMQWAFREGRSTDHVRESIMASKGGGGKGGSKGGGGRPANGPSTTGGKSGGGRGNNPAGGKGK